MKKDQTSVSKENFKCSGCGAILQFAPGTESLKCMYCGTMNKIAAPRAEIKEIDYHSFISEQYEKEEKISIATLKCPTCGARVTLKPDVTSDHCPYCGTSLVVSGGSTSTVLKPKSLLPFQITRKKARENFSYWLDHLWFAPNDLKSKAAQDRLQGIYSPYWTYDSDTFTSYSGMRGDYYYVTENYTTTENGKTVVRQRQVRHTRWTPARGSVSARFDDILVPGSRSLPEKHVIQLEPWPLKELKPYNDKYLAGFRSETYQVDLTRGLETAKGIMTGRIKSLVRSDIGGDVQQISSLTTDYNGITFKHILLPIWISSYKYGSKVYRFLINGCTGEVQGDRPYSWIKITLLILALLGVAAIVFFIAGK